MALPERDLPQRRYPVHLGVVERANRSAIVFLTVCVQGRRPILNRPEVHRLMHALWSDASCWTVGRYILMPDHVHLFCSRTHREAPPLKQWVKYWKSSSTRQWPCDDAKPIWQRDHWDRQLRTSEGYSEKWAYVEANPVRAGLCEYPAAWPFRGEISVFRFHD